MSGRRGARLARTIAVTALTAMLVALLLPGQAGTWLLRAACLIILGLAVAAALDVFLDWYEQRCYARWEHDRELRYLQRVTRDERGWPL